MTLHRFVWQAKDACEFIVLGEGDPYKVKATPVVTSYWFGTTVGFFFRNTEEYGYWQSSNICGPITAWRVAQILPRVQRLRELGSGYDTTLCGLVIAMNGDRHEERMFNRASDLGMTVSELNEELLRLKGLWPTAVELCAMWDKLPEKAQDGLVIMSREAIATGKIEGTQELVNRLEVAELRMRTSAEQKVYEETLISAGLSAEGSLRQFLIDIGVGNVVYTLGVGDLFEPSHFNFDDLDREIMRNLIGSGGYYHSISLITTAKQPDDPSAHYSTGGDGFAMHWSDFGERGHPRIVLEDVERDLVAVQWDRVTERFVLRVRPHGLGERNDSQDVLMAIIQLRGLIGIEAGLKRALQPGEVPSWRQRPKRSWRRGR